MKYSHKKIWAVVAAMALMAPAGAIAKPGKDKPAKDPKPPKVKTVSVNLKGIVTANDGTTVTVAVDKVSGQAKGCKGKSLSFTATKVHVADNDGDGDADLADVLVGHAVKVQAKVPKAAKGSKGTCTVEEGSAVPAKQIHDRTTPPVDDDDEGEETETETPAETPAETPTDPTTPTV